MTDQATIDRLEVDPDSTHPNHDSCGIYANKFFEVGETHEHSYLHNCNPLTDKARKLGSPCAVPITQSFSDFDDALLFVCGRLNIGNPGDFPSPKPQLLLV